MDEQRMSYKGESEEEMRSVSDMSAVDGEE
jgi:hypothetical protein